MQNSFKNSYFKSFLVFIFNFNRHYFTIGKPILLHLLRYRALAVKDIKFGGGLCSFRFLTPFLVLFFRLLRNSPRPWVRHTRSPALPDSL
jgi:hypothetical protein